MLDIYLWLFKLCWYYEEYEEYNEFMDPTDKYNICKVYNAKESGSRVESKETCKEVY